MANCLLYSGIKNLLRCDEAEVVQGIARYVISQHRSVRVVSRFVQLTKHTPFPAALTLLAWTRSFLAVCAEGPLVGAAWIARLSNERRALEPLIALSPELEWTELKFQSRMSMSAALKLTLRNLKYIARVYRIGRRMHRRFESFKAMRVIELLGYYARYVEVFGQGNFTVARRGSLVCRSCSSHTACRCGPSRDSSTISQSFTRKRRAKHTPAKVAKSIGY
jgi:hypothetical protein